MNTSKKAFLIFIVALLVLTFAASQVWVFALEQRRGEVGLAEALVGVMSMPLLLASGIVVLRLLYVTARPRSKRHTEEHNGGRRHVRNQPN